MKKWEKKNQFLRFFVSTFLRFTLNSPISLFVLCVGFFDFRSSFSFLCVGSFDYSVHEGGLGRRREERKRGSEGVRV
ncbi:hypothetical protein BVRB_9g207280 [Beta vulgaris subsp. vulgaris]|nr:hypothetical protein BVRB_9g207280 [Beta vulgaris subsp. vulgaris]